MSYIKEHLNPGERIVYRTTLHPIIFTSGALEVLVSLILFANHDQDFAGLLFLVGCIVLLYEGVRFSTSEFAVTNTRVVIKTGWFNRRSLEVQLAKVEAVAVDQDPLGRGLDYGTLTVGGTGGTKEKFTVVRAPILLRKQIQQQIEQQPAVGSPVTPSRARVPVESTEARTERECPHCAERILAKATRCRFCGQPVEPQA